MRPREAEPCPRHGPRRVRHRGGGVPLLALTILLGPALAVPGSLTGQEVACVPGDPDPGAPAEMAHFEFLLGRWDIRARRWSDEGGWSEGYSEAYWEGEYILGGYAIADYWYDTPPDGSGSPAGRGVNVRMYDPEAGFWRMTWQHTGLSGVRLLEAEARDDGIVVMWQLRADGSRFPGRRVTFHVEGPDRWHRIDEFSDDGGETWSNGLKLEAIRRDCR